MNEMSPQNMQSYFLNHVSKKRKNVKMHLHKFQANLEYISFTFPRYFNAFNPFQKEPKR